MNSEEEKLKEVKVKANIFLKEKTFVFIKAIKSNGNYVISNGYVKEVFSNYINFEDVMDKKEIPFLLTELIREGAIFDVSRINKGEVK